MPVFTSHAPGTPCWVDLSSPDVDAAKAFYTALFGWDAEDLHHDGARIYTRFTKDGHAVAGLGGQQPGMEGMPAVWNSYVSVDDCSATVERAVAAGATVVLPPMPVMDAGEMAVLADPTGAVISLWKAGTSIGTELGNEPDTYSWNELLDREVETAKAFYTAVFGWTYDEMDMGELGTYSVIAGGDNGGLGGLMAMPPQMPAMVPNHWAVYFTVTDLDATIATATGNGGQVVQPPMIIPGIGTMATLHDPAGGSFAVLQPLPRTDS